jgi:glycosyltransferase involved in cell wall biosynthesis
LTVEYSVVIPTFNRRSVLGEVLAALEGQLAAPPFEILVVDDGSTDGTYEWLGELSAGRPLHRIRQANRGPAAARNRGVEAAAGTWVAFLGDDTVPESDWLALHAARHRAEKLSAAEAKVAVLGYTAWHPRMWPDGVPAPHQRVRSLQFGYAMIAGFRPRAVQLLLHLESLAAQASGCSRGALRRDAFRIRPGRTSRPRTGLSRRGLRLVYEAAGARTARPPDRLSALLPRARSSAGIERGALRAQAS